MRGGGHAALRAFPPAQLGSRLLLDTGDAAHLAALRAHASAKGQRIIETGLIAGASNAPEPFREEAALYDRLGLQYIAPELRQGAGEVELAARGSLPTLVGVSDLKGDLHVHTDASDGNDTLEAMVEAARRRGLEYLAITDHSAGQTVAHGLDVERLRAHVGRVRALDTRVPDIALLAGSEVDIRPDGAMDYPDDVLAELDVVIGSIHSALGQDRERMTERVIRAMENPHVDIIGHLTARLIGSRDPVSMDVERVLQAARRTGTAIEINAAPRRLDLNAAHARRARELGVSLVINTDAHFVRDLGRATFGITVARRAWCEPGDILNTIPISQSTTKTALLVGGGLEYSGK